MEIKLRKTSLIAVIGLFLFLLSLGAEAKSCSVAVVVDRTTYGQASDAVNKYSAAIKEHDGKKTFVIVLDDDVRPEVIRDTLQYLYKHHSLEGAVLVGDLPVPMVRRAHHLATAFKMNPKADWHASSIPSDRFYDDFGLKFNYLKNDGRMFFYDLSPEGRQKVECSIYSARVKPSRLDPEHSFTELVAEFLDRAAEAKNRPEKIDNVYHFGGHGNSSESFNARIDEDKAMAEQFGFEGPGERVYYTNFDEDRYVKPRIQAILADQSLDYVHFHSHGATDTQYLSKTPYSFMTSDYVENARLDLRNRMRRAKDKETTARALLGQFGVDESWIAGWDDPLVEARDSIRAANLDIYLDDLDGFESGPKVVILDACFNGAFIHDDYVAARYAFNHGSHSLAVFGNSVNIIQDHWKNELAGLMATGVCVGNWAKENFTLESHLFGDPTCAFEASRKKTVDHEVLRIKHGKYSLAKVKDILKTGKSMNVRLEALMYIFRHASSTDDIAFAVRTGLEDPYEMIRRMSAKLGATSGDPVLLEVAAKHYLDPLEGSRVRFQLANALEQYPADDLRKALDKARRDYWIPESTYQEQVKRMYDSRIAARQEFANIADSSVNIKDRRFTVSGMRNKCIAAAIDPMITVIADETEDQDLRLKSAEALGWYVLSFRRAEIYARLKALDIRDAEVKDEVHRTLRRLEDNANL